MGKSKEGVRPGSEVKDLPDLPLERVEVPEWDTVIYVRSLDGIERDEFDVARMVSQEAGNPPNVRGWVVSRVAADENGTRLFSDDDAHWLGRKSGKVLNRIWVVADRLNAFTTDQLAELEKNLEAGPGDSSSSPSQSD